MTLLSLVACTNPEPYELYFGDEVVLLRDAVRDGSVSPPTADTTNAVDDALDALTAKARVDVRRGGGGRAVVLLRQYVPARPNSPDASVESEVLFTINDLGGLPVMRRHGVVGDVVSTAPIGLGLLALACHETRPPLVYRWEGASSTFPGETNGPPTDTWEALGLCDGPSRLGVTAEGDFLVVTDAAVTRVDTAGGLVTTDLGPPPGPLADAVWLDEVGGVVTVVTAGFRWTTSDGGAAEAVVDGEPLGDPVWRGADGDLRIATTAGLWRWTPPADPQRIAPAPASPVDGGWTVSGAGLRAVAAEVNEAAPELDVPVAAALAFADDFGWRVTEVPTTPCPEVDTCRGYGESEVLGGVGAAADPIPVYDLWYWTEAERHETWASPR